MKMKRTADVCKMEFTPSSGTEAFKGETYQKLATETPAENEKNSLTPYNNTNAKKH